MALDPPDATPRRPLVDEFMAIEPRALERAYLPAFLDDEAPRAQVDGGVAVVEVSGPLERRAGWFWDGYQGPGGVVARFRAALSSAEARAVVLRINSPGGTCAGFFDALDEMRAAKAAAGKPVVTFAETAYSAGYGLATLGDRVVVSRAGGVGSVGVVNELVSLERALAKDGVDVAVVASGAHKTDGHPAVAITDAAKARARARVMELAGLFADEVARARGMTREAVLAQQAALFHGEAAVAAGLADEVGTLASAVGAARARADERAARAAKERLMTTVATNLGLAATATEAEVAARADALRRTEAQLLEATGATSAGEALGRMMAWKDAAARVEAVERDAAAVRTRERAAAVRAAVDGGRLTPAQATFALELAEKDPAMFDGYMATVPAAPIVQRPGEVRVPARPDPNEAAERLEAESVGMSLEDYRKAQARMRKEGVIR